MGRLCGEELKGGRERVHMWCKGRVKGKSINRVRIEQEKGQNG